MRLTEASIGEAAGATKSSGFTTRYDAAVINIVIEMRTKAEESHSNFLGWDRLWYMNRNIKELEIKWGRALLAEWQVGLL